MTEYVKPETAASVSRRAFLMGGLGLLAAAPALADEPVAAEDDSFEAASLRIHFVCSAFHTYINQDIIVLEMIGSAGDKRFVLVDGGFGPESGNSHEGYVNRYHADQCDPELAVVAWNNTKKYYDNLGINASNVAFYFISHCHADHMGCAPELIEAFRPPIIYTPEYSEDYLLPDTEAFVNPEGQTVTGYNLHDNQWNYDRVMQAAESIGSPVITSINSWDEASFSVGGVKFTIVGWDSDYRERTGNDRLTNANDFCWGIVIEGCGRKIFLGGDITDVNGSETDIARWVRTTYGYWTSFDLVKLNHHGLEKSNTSGLISALRPQIAFSPSVNRWPFPDLMTQLSNLGTRLFTLEDIQTLNMGAFVVSLSRADVSTNFDGIALGRTTRAGNLLYYGGTKVTADGWHAYNGNYYFTKSGVFYKGWAWADDDYYYFYDTAEVRLGWNDNNGHTYYLEANSSRPVWAKSKFVYVNGLWYYFDANGFELISSWVKHNGVWYYLGADGTLYINRWLKYNGAWYFLGPDGGLYIDKWLKYGGSWYYLGPNGTMYANRWLSSGGAYYYLGASGAMYANGTYTVNGARDRFDGSGRLSEGWVYSKNWYYMKSNGRWAKNEWVKTLDYGYCYFGSNGAYQKRWQ